MMNPAISSSEQETGRAKAHQYFRAVMERHKLPSLMLVTNKILHMLKDPDLSLRQLCRVLADDAALVTRVLALSRSPHYAQRNAPRNLLEAVPVLGLKTLRGIVLTSATQSLMVRGSKISEKLWNHSLAVALAARILAGRIDGLDGDDAFLAGLLHDIGQMVFAYGDPRGFAKIAEDLDQTHRSLNLHEEKIYGVDHTLIGVTLLEMWNIDGSIGSAVLNHHDCSYLDGPNTLITTLSLADFLCPKVGLGGIGTLPLPPEPVLTTFDCAEEAAMEGLLSEVQKAFDEEMALFRTP
jgi:putative nucleotidyltransferase with HDIG domain